MSHYPAGSMQGSGIYSTEVTMDVGCKDCDFEGEVDVSVNDFSSGTWNCPVGHENEMDMDDYNEPDPDEARDRMMDDRMDWS